MLKWILVAILVALVVGGGGKRILGLFQAAKKLPDDFTRGQRRVDDPASEAKPVNDAPKDR